MKPVHWLLLRGLVRERRHWLDFPQRLAARTGGEVLCLDLPGVGTEAHRKAPLTIGENVADLRRRFHEQRQEGEWRLLGPSLGGMIALSWAAQHPEDFQQVAVSNTSARDLARPLERFRPVALKTVVTGLLSRDRVERERRVLRLTSNHPKGPDHAAIFATLSQESPIGPNVLLRQLVAASGIRAPTALSIPLLVLCSEGDRLCSPEASRRLAERLGARLAVHPDAGHDLPLDAPEWVMDRLMEGAMWTGETPGL